MKKLLFITTSLLLAGCYSSQSDAENTLHKAGFTDITVTGLAPLSCGENDISRTGFVATNSQGARVEGVVCCGIFKSCTIRF